MRQSMRTQHITQGREVLHGTDGEPGRPLTSPQISPPLFDSRPLAQWHPDEVDRYFTALIESVLRGED